MVRWTHYALFVSILIGVVAALFGIHGDLGSDPALAGFLAIGGALFSGSVYGLYQHLKATEEHDERGMAIRYRSGYVSFWAVFWVLFVLTLGSVEGGIPVGTEEFVLVVWSFAVLVALTTRTWYKRQF